MDATDAQAKETARKPAGDHFEEDLVTRNLIGSPETIVRQVQAHANAGVNSFELKECIIPSSFSVHMSIELLVYELGKQVR